MSVVEQKLKTVKLLLPISTEQWMNPNMANLLFSPVAREGKMEKSPLVLILLGLENGASFASQPRSDVKQNQSKCELLWKPPLSKTKGTPEHRFSIGTRGSGYLGITV